PPDQPGARPVRQDTRIQVLRGKSRTRRDARRSGIGDSHTPPSWPGIAVRRTASLRSPMRRTAPLSFPYAKDSAASVRHARPLHPCLHRHSQISRGNALELQTAKMAATEGCISALKSTIARAVSRLGANL